jgi:septal ring factor EnvC (AmiA/AmiB activator)
MSNLIWVTAIISSLTFASTPDYSKLVRELDRAEIKAGKAQEQYDSMASSIKSANGAVTNLEKEIELKGQAISSKKVFARERIGYLLKYSVPDNMDFLSAFDNVEETQRVKVLLAKMLKRDVQDYNDLNSDLNQLDELKKILAKEKQELEVQSKVLSSYIVELKATILQKKRLLEKIRNSQKGAKALAERSKKSASRISGIVSGAKFKDMKATMDEVIQKLVSAPLKGKVITAFGKVWDTTTKNWVYNKGVGIEAEYGKEVKSASAGIVSYSGWIPGYGKVLIVKHDEGFFSVYGHLSKILLNKGVKVGKGVIIGYVGDTGSVDMPSLYFELSTPTRNIDPSPLFD